MTTSQFDFHLNRPGALIAALPAVLGFVPEKSLVLVTVDGGEMGCVMRVDLSPELPDSVDHLAEVAAAARPDAAIAVIVDDDGAACRLCNDEYATAAQNLEDCMASQGIELLDFHVVDRVAAAAGGTASTAAGAPSTTRRRRRWRWPRCWTVAGCTPGARSCRRSSRSPTQRGERSRWSSRDTPRRPTPRSTTRARRRARDGCGWREWPQGRSCPHDAVARLACALTDPQVRDTLYALAVGERAAEAEALWALLARTLPAPWRVEALVLLAFSAYARGDGPLAGVSLEAALRCDPGAPDGGHARSGAAVGDAARADPRSSRATGYRLAKRLGVELPPTQRTSADGLAESVAALRPSRP